MKRTMKKIAFDAFCLLALSFSFFVANILPILGPIGLAIYLGRHRVCFSGNIRLLRNYFFASLLIGETIFWVATVGHSCASIVPLKHEVFWQIIFIVLFFSTFISLVFFFLGSHWYKPETYTVSYNHGGKSYQ